MIIHNGLTLLRNLPTPIIDLTQYTIQYNSIISAQIHELLTQLHHMSIVQYRTLELLIVLLRRLLRHSKQNGLTLDQLQLLFTPLIFGVNDIVLSPTAHHHKNERKILKQPLQVQMTQYMLQHDTFELL